MGRDSGSLVQEDVGTDMICFLAAYPGLTKANERGSLSSFLRFMYRFASSLSFCMVQFTFPGSLSASRKFLNAGPRFLIAGI